MQGKKKITFDLFIRGVIAAAIAVAALLIVKRLSNVLLPFFIAWLLAYLIFPLVRFFQHRCRMKNRVLAVTCTLLALALVGASVFYLLVPPIVKEFIRMQSVVIHYFTASPQDSGLPNYINRYIQENFTAEHIIMFFNSDDFLATLHSTLPRVWGVVTEGINLLFSAFSIAMTLLYVLFILLDYEYFAERWVSLIPKRFQPFCVNLQRDLGDGMNRYFRGQARVAACVAVLFCAGFIIIGFPMPIALGLFIGALNMVPYLQVVGVIPTIALAILKSYDTGTNLWFILMLAALVFVVVQIIQDGYLVPRIMGKATGLNPAIILLSLSIWGSLMGIIGMVIALPVTTLLITYYQRYVIDRHKLVLPDEAEEQPGEAEEQPESHAETT